MAKLTLTDVQPDELYILEKKRKPKSNLPAWDAFGGNMEYKTEIENYPDLYDVIQNMSKQTAWLWWELVKLRNRKSNVAVYTPKDKVASNRLYKAFKELKDLDLVRRIKRSHYIINPSALLPVFSEYEEVFKQWESL